MRLLAYLQSLTWCISLVQGNVEKTIFLGPEAIQIPQQHPSLQDLKLESLSPSEPVLRRQLSAAFPKPSTPKGTEAWFLLEGLKQYQRYEVRICWAATVSLLKIVTHYSFWQGCLRMTRLTKTETATDFIHTQHLHYNTSIRYARINYFPLNLL